MSTPLDRTALDRLQCALTADLGSGAVQVGVPMARHTTLRIGGPADLLVVVDTVDALRRAAALAWSAGVPFRVLGAGSNVLVSDAGVPGLVIVNRARGIAFVENGVRAESGAALSLLAGTCAAEGLAGLEWAAGIPGTVGGAVIGNAGAWGGNVASVLSSIWLLEPDGTVAEWPVERMGYGYRTSVLKRGNTGPTPLAVVLEVQFRLQRDDPKVLQSRLAEMSVRRRASQPPGATCGCVFKNPPGDYAGRLIDAAGLKGARIGGAEISPVHANFIVNQGTATAADVQGLIDKARQAVHRRSGILLELEIERLGNWPQEEPAHPRKLVVGLFFGGRSGEHEVSLLSARGVLEAIDREKYDVVPIGITKEGHWVVGVDPLRLPALAEPAPHQFAALLPEPGQRNLVRLEETQAQQALSAAWVSQLDAVLPILHGPYGEDGTLQGLLELAGLPYVGAGVTASAVGMDKALFKDLMRAHQIPVVRYLVVKRRDWERQRQDTIRLIEKAIGYDCFVKPACLGSSVGVSRAHDRAGLAAALDEAARYDRKLIVEEAIDAREIEVSVLGNDEPLASVPGEIVPSRDYYDYAAKYLDGTSELLIPAPIPLETAELVRRLAVSAYLAIDCNGMARADFLLDRHSGEVYVSEVNTIPGFTPISMYPKLWEASGIPYSQLIDRLIELALERHADRSRSATTYRPPDEE